MVLRRAALALVLLLAGCGVQRQVRTAPTTPVSAVPMVATSSPASPAPTVAPTASAPPRLAAALLARGDLPAGWTVQPVFDLSSLPPAMKSGCKPFDAYFRRAGAWASSSFTSGDGLTAVTEDIRSTTVTEAKRQLDDVRRVVEQCLTITMNDDNGDSYMLEVSEPKQILLGDDSYTLRFGGELFTYLNLVAIRQGGIVLTVMSSTPEPESPLLAKLAGDAYAKMRRTLG